jgi:predicted dehydrogenase
MPAPYGHSLDVLWKNVPRTQLVAVADDDPAGLAAALGKTGAPQGYADYREMLDRERLDVVCVAPRWTDRHAELVLAALEHGCHVYMEKPFCRSLEEADAQLAIAHQTRWSPLLAAVQREIKAGAIGKVLELRGRGKEDPKRGGGEDLWVLGCHIFDLMRAIAGDPLTCMATVLNQGHRAGPKDVAEGPEGLGPIAGDQVNATIQFADGVVGFFGSQRAAGRTDNRFGLQIYGTDGVIDLLTGHMSPCHVLQDSAWSPGRTGKGWVPLTSNGIGQPETIEDGGLPAGNVLAVNDLLDCIENPMRRPKCNVYDARWTVEMVLGVYASHRHGGPVKLPLEDRRHPLAST